MSLFGLKSKTGDAAINLTHYDGVPGFGNLICELTLHNVEEKLEIHEKWSKKPSVFLPYNKIVGVTYTTEKEIKEQGKSVLGRAAIGGVLLGPLGALIGGMSGTGTKQKTKYNFYILINYKPDPENDEIKVLCFADNTMINGSKFVKLLKEQTGLLNNQMEINL